MSEDQPAEVQTGKASGYAGTLMSFVTQVGFEKTLVLLVVIFIGWQMHQSTSIDRERLKTDEMRAQAEAKRLTGFEAFVDTLEKVRESNKQDTAAIVKAFESLDRAITSSLMRDRDPCEEIGSELIQGARRIIDQCAMVCYTKLQGGQPS